jgi:hypothetical protein
MKPERKAMDILLTIITVLRSLLPTASERQPAEVPPITTATSIRLIERGAILAEDFDAKDLDRAKWRVWQENADRTADGKQVASVRSSNMGFYLLPLKDASWDVYPVAAEVRVLLDGKSVGKPLQIECNGMKGLYPDDVRRGATVACCQANALGGLIDNRLALHEHCLLKLS